MLSDAHSTSSEQRIVNGVCFIHDVNCESTLHAVHEAVQNESEFCVCGSATFNQLKATSSVSVSSDSATSFLCMSAGSSGTPKTIRRTHQSWINSFRISAESAQLGTADSYAIVGKLSHSLPLYAAMEAMWIGADVHALSDVRPDKQLAAMLTWESSVLYATPTQLRQLSDSSTQVAQSIRHIFCGGGKLDKATRIKLATQFPNACVKEFYGASETSFISISDKQTPNSSVGRLYPGVQLQIKPTDAEHNNAAALPTGEIGEIWVKSPYLFEHYGHFSEPDTRWHNDYLCIGEMGYLDTDGYLYVCGRRSRLVNVSDSLVNPEQAESVLSEHANVRHCAVVARPDKRRGNVLMGFVEANQFVQGLQNESLRLELLQHCRRQLGSLLSPRDIVIVEQLPLLASGKPDLLTIENQASSAGDTIDE